MKGWIEIFFYIVLIISNVLFDVIMFRFISEDDKSTFYEKEGRETTKHATIDRLINVSSTKASLVKLTKLGLMILGRTKLWMKDIIFSYIYIKHMK